MITKLPHLSLFLFIIFIVVASWFLVHLLAIFGVFLAVAYPLWWLFYPKLTVCIFCRSKQEGKRCPFCHQIIRKGQGISPKTFSSTILNGLLIFFLSVVSIVLVFTESRVLNFLGFPLTAKTVSFVIPTKGQYRLDEIFPVKIELIGIKKSINAVQADLGFDSKIIEAVEVSTEDSFANIFIQKEINNEVGHVRLTGGLPNPGFFADHGLFGTVFFKGKSPGVVKIEFLPSSMVLANDGRGTNVLKDLASVSYLILPEKISEEEKMQKSITLQSSLLRESTNNTQMKFYEETGVLGTYTEKEIKKEQQLNPVKICLSVLGEIDTFILSQWQAVFDLSRQMR